MKAEDGTSALLWHDVWLGDSSLRSRFPSVFFVVAGLTRFGLGPSLGDISCSLGRRFS